MSWSYVAHRGSANNKTSGTTISVSPTADLAVGAIVIVRCAADNIGTTSGANTDEHSLSDTHGHTWVKLREHRVSAGSSADGVTVSLWAAKITTQISTSDSITLTLSSARVAKCIAVEEFATNNNKTFGVAGAASTHSSNASPSVSISNLSSAERLWLGTIGAEGPNGDGYTQDSDYANNTSIGTTGGTAISNVYSRFGSRIATITSDTFNPTIEFPRDHCALLVALDEIDDDIVVTPPPAESKVTALIGSVILGSLIVTAATASARVTAIAPAVELGSVTVTPATSVARALAVAPIVEIGGGGTNVSPAFAASRAIAVAPVVQLGSVAVTPTEAAVLATAIAPTVELGSIIVMPAFAAIQALAVSPSVQIGDGLFPTEGRLVVTARAQGRSFVAVATGRSWVNLTRDRKRS